MILVLIVFDCVEAILTCRIPHPFLIIINATTSIGQDGTIYYQVTIGNLESVHYYQMGGGSHNKVYIGCGTTIIGDVSIGRNVRIGAMSLVLKDLEVNNTVVSTYK